MISQCLSDITSDKEHFDKAVYSNVKTNLRKTISKSFTEAFPMTSQALQVL